MTVDCEVSYEVCVFFSFRKRTRMEKLCISILSIKKKGKEASFFIEGVIMKGVNNDAKFSLFRNTATVFAARKDIIQQPRWF
jgi:hypothetical protein